MTLIPIKLPPGMSNNGTQYGAKGRWHKGSLVRWFGGTLRSIGGWEPMRNNSGIVMPSLVTDPLTETARDSYAWVDNAGGTNSAYGTNNAVYTLTPATTLVNITPDGTVPGPNQPSSKTGYGTGYYGRGTYGTPRVGTGSKFSQIKRWTFDAWGQDLLASYSPGGIGLHARIPGGAKLVLVPNAPVLFNHFAVTQQRFVMVVGADGVYNRVKWSDREDLGLWTPAVTNEAGDIDLQTHAPLTFIGRVLNQMLILGVDAYVGRYIGPPYVYGFDLVGRECAAVHPKAVACTDRFAMWVGRRSFWMYDGTVKAMESEIIDYIIEDMNYDMLSKMYTTSNSIYNEIWWFYQSKSAANNEVDSYVIFDFLRNTWNFGRLPRTTGFDFGVYNQPVYVTVDGKIMLHELEAVIPVGAYAETGPLELGEGERNMVVRAIYPDTQAFGDVSVTLLGKAMPNEPEYSYGPYLYNNPTPTRADGRQIRMRIDGSGANWEFGTARFDVAQGGVR